MRPAYLVYATTDLRPASPGFVHYGLLVPIVI
jgi:hypothetical protein